MPILFGGRSRPLPLLLPAAAAAFGFGAAEAVGATAAPRPTATVDVASARIRLRRVMVDLLIVSPSRDGRDGSGEPRRGGAVGSESATPSARRPRDPVVGAAGAPCVLVCPGSGLERRPASAPPRLVVERGPLARPRAGGTRPTVSRVVLTYHPVVILRGFCRVSIKSRKVVGATSPRRRGGRPGREIGRAHV